MNTSGTCLLSISAPPGCRLHRPDWRPCGHNFTKLAQISKSRPCLHRIRQSVKLQASGGDNQKQELTIDFQTFARTPVFKYVIQGLVFLVVLAGVDAAYSGDWSRVGVISKEFEDGLKPLVVALGAFHIACAVVAGRSAASKGISVPPAVLKVLAVGFLAMVEVLAAEPVPKEQ